MDTTFVFVLISVLVLFTNGNKQTGVSKYNRNKDLDNNELEAEQFIQNLRLKIDKSSNIKGEFDAPYNAVGNKWSSPYLNHIYDSFEGVSDWKTNDVVSDFTIDAFLSVGSEILPDGSLTLQYSMKKKFLPSPNEHIELVFEPDLTSINCTPQSEVKATVCLHNHICHSDDKLNIMSESTFYLAEITHLIKAIQHKIRGTKTRIYDTKGEDDININHKKSGYVDIQVTLNKFQKCSPLPILVRHSVSKSKYPTFLAPTPPVNTDYDDGNNHESRLRRDLSKLAIRNDVEGKKEKIIGEKFEACGMKSWELVFDHLGWGDWIMQPKSYQASICAGSCSIDHTENENVNVSTNAFLRQAYHKHAKVKGSYPKQKVDVTVPAPVCVPIQTAPQNFLFLNRDNSLTYMSVPDVVATDCGCL